MNTPTKAQETKEAIMNMRVKNPCATLRQIGSRYGISHEYVRLVLSKANLPTQHFIVKQQYLCVVCGSIIPWHGKKYCCPQCQWDDSHVPILCGTCKGIFYVLKSQVTSQNYAHNPRFCSKKCQGKYIGKRYGFAVYPGNAGTGRGHKGETRGNQGLRRTGAE